MLREREGKKGRARKLNIKISPTLEESRDQLSNLLWRNKEEKKEKSPSKVPRVRVLIWEPEA